MTIYPSARLPLFFFALVVIASVAACSNDEGPEGQISDGPLVPAISMEYPASDIAALAQADTICKNHGQRAKLDKAVQRGGVAINVYKCQ